MDNINNIFYKDSRKKLKKYTNTALIMEALHTLLNDVNELKAGVASAHRDSAITQALKDELQTRITGPYLADLKE